jgi:hypothetical protein
MIEFDDAFLKGAQQLLAHGSKFDTIEYSTRLSDMARRQHQTSHGRELIKHHLDQLQHHGLVLEPTNLDRLDSAIPLGSGITALLNNDSLKFEKQAASGVGVIHITARSPEFLPELAQKLDIRIVLLSSRSKPKVFGPLKPALTIGIFKAEDSALKIGVFSLLILRPNHVLQAIPV